MKHLHSHFFLFLVTLFLVNLLSAFEVCDGKEPTDDCNEWTNKLNSEDPTGSRQLIVLSVPSVNSEYYKKNHQKIIDFNIDYVEILKGNDNVVVLTDRATLSYIRDDIPDDAILLAGMDDIWMRDFTTTVPKSAIEFKYDRPSSGDDSEVQPKFDELLEALDLSFTKDDLKVDGGNVVDNNKDKVVMTQKVLERNPEMTQTQITDKLKLLWGVQDIAIVPMDEVELGHSDGIVMFVDDNHLIVNNYTTEPSFRTSVVTPLRNAFGNDINITFMSGEGYGGSADGIYASACGIYVNSLVTNEHIYLPTFRKPVGDAAAKSVIESTGTSKKVHSVDCADVCSYGGNVRCLSWQLMGGDNADKIMKAAREPIEETTAAIVMFVFSGVFVLLGTCLFCFCCCFCPLACLFGGIGGCIYPCDLV